jgi:hypothetical protein
MKTNPSAQSAAIPPTREDITLRAITLWKNYGQPEGRDTEIWLEAERQLIGLDPSVKNDLKNDRKASGVAFSFGETLTPSKPRAAAKKSGSSPTRSRR